MAEDKQLALPITAEGLEVFLASPFTKGVGKVYSKKISEAYGQEILNPEFDFSKFHISGLGEAKVKEFAESMRSLKIPAKTIAFLYSGGLKDIEVEKIISHYGKRTEKIVLWDPYSMVEEVWKFSFFSADKIGRYLGIDSLDPRRLRGALLTAVKFYAEEGSMFATEEQAVTTASKISGAPVESVRIEISKIVEEGRIIKSLDGLYLPPYFRAEEEAARKLKSLIRNKETEFSDITIPETDIDGHPLNREQKNAIQMALQNNVSVITGGPGTGKTTTVNGIINLLMGMGKKVVLAAPTGRAAKRMSDLTGEEAKTIHRLLGYSMGKGYKNKHFDADILVIDEASMLEQVLFNHLLQALNDGTKVVLVGDTDQLPAIGAGNVLRDLIDSGQVPVTTLTENFRQEEGSLIASNASNIREGEMPDPAPSNDFVYLEEKGVSNIHSRILSLVAEEIPSYTGILPKDIQVVSPQQEGPLGAKQLNIELQERINPGAPELKRGLKRFRLGDRVMQTTNNSIRGIYNGETGCISALNPESKTLEVTFNDGKKSLYNINELRELTLAYATTVHKLQGCETDYMLMIVTTAHRPMLYRNLLYTGVSRAKKLCVIIGEEAAMKTALENKEKIKRNSNFKRRLEMA